MRPSGTPSPAHPASQRAGRSLLRAILLALLLGVGTGPGPAASAEEPSKGTFTPPKAIHQESPIVPEQVERTAFPGSAEIRCTLDEFGTIVDAKVVSASRPEFGESALAAAYLWKFEPARIDGKPVSRVISIPFVFQPNLNHPLEQAVSRVVFVEPTSKPVPAESLGRMPEPKRRAWPRYPEELRGTRTKGAVVLAFVIAPDGQVVNPEIISATHPSFEVPSILSVLALQFPPVLDAKGKPLWVSMLLRYEFDESMLKEQDKENQRRIVVPQIAIPRSSFPLPRPPRQSRSASSP
ncbi:MAG: TonB family protein [Opitutaceae bacterium]